MSFETIFFLFSQNLVYCLAGQSYSVKKKKFFKLNKFLGDNAPLYFRILGIFGEKLWFNP